MPKAFTFDVTLSGSVTIDGETEGAARKELERLLTGCSANLGAFKNGDPILCELWPTDEDMLCSSVDGDPPEFPSKAHYDRAARDDGWLPTDSDTADEYCKANDVDASQIDLRSTS